MVSSIMGYDAGGRPSECFSTVQSHAPRFFVLPTLTETPARNGKLLSMVRWFPGSNKKHCCLFASDLADHGWHYSSTCLVTTSPQAVVTQPLEPKLGFLHRHNLFLFQGYGLVGKFWKVGEEGWEGKIRKYEALISELPPRVETNILNFPISARGRECWKAITKEKGSQCPQPNGSEIPEGEGKDWEGVDFLLKLDLFQLARWGDFLNACKTWLRF